MTKPNVKRISRAVAHKQSDDKQEKSKSVSHLYWLLVPVVTIIVLYVLCLLKIFCLSDLFQTKQPQVIGKVTQQVQLQGDVLSLTEANSVNLSDFHEYYEAGEGLSLSDFTFSLAEAGVVPGEYGDSNAIPVVTVDKFGRIEDIRTVPVAVSTSGSAVTINNMTGPDFSIVGTQNQVDVQSLNNTIMLALPQDIHNDATPLFKTLFLTEDLHLHGMIYDSNDVAGSANQLLVSTGSGVVWQDIGAVVGDDQTLTWNDITYDLTIEDGNTVNLGALNLWQQNAIGGYYTTDEILPRDANVQRLRLEHTSWGLTELQVRNNDNSNNYSAAVLNLKGSGPDYTNNMFFAKLGDNYYVPSWAGKGVVSSDQPLIVASVRSNDPAHPNNTPYIMFQTGGYYTAPEDKMILDSEGQLGIGTFSPIATLDLMPIPNNNLTINIRSKGGNSGLLGFVEGNGADSVFLRAPADVSSSFTLVLPSHQGTTYDVMYNDGSGNLLWDKVEHLLSIGVGDHSVLYSNGTNIVGDSDAFYWDYDNHRLGINRNGETPQVALHITSDNSVGVALESLNGSYSKFVAYGRTASCSSPYNCTRIQFSSGRIEGTYYNDQRWSIGRDEFGSALAGLRLNHRNGIWASGYDLHLRVNDIDAINLQTTGGVRYIYTDTQFDVGIGTSTPTAKLQVGDSGDGTYAVANAWNTFSDERLKENIKDIPDILDKVLKLEPVTYTWKSGKDKSTQIGFIAQDVLKLFPEVVKKLTNDIYTIDYSKITVYLVGAIKEIYAEVTDLKKQIADLQNQNKELEQRVNDLEQRLDRLEQNMGEQSSQDNLQDDSEENTPNDSNESGDMDNTDSNTENSEDDDQNNDQSVENTSNDTDNVGDANEGTANNIE